MIALVVVAVVFIVYSLVAARLDRWSVTAPMVFVITGAAIGILAPEWLGFLDEPEPVKLIAELTLALLLFADASTLRWSELREDGFLPARLLLIGFPLTVLAGFGVGLLVEPTAPWAAAALIAAILAPTDAALGLGVFTNRSVPGRIRRALNVESGLNDGLATPLVTLFLAFLITHEGAETTSWVADSLKELGIAIVVAVIVGSVSGRLIALAQVRAWTSAAPERFAVLATALLAYGGAIAVGGNGFVAAFVGGLVFSLASGGKVRESVEFTEDLGLFSSFLVWSIFGALLLGPVFEGGTRWTPIVYAVLSLTAIRMVPVALSMIGSGLRTPSVLFLGWFGPRGLASVVFTLLAVESLAEEGLVSAPLVEITTWTVFLSVILHGITARPLSRIYGAWAAGDSVDPPEIEASDVGPVPRSLSTRRSGNT
ncbi:MAG TPA: cation:proton antiporter [Acidimicrobiia bacterium]|nr:cation:proton antiporter [Acidimicrobiia bacterium]